MKICKYCGTNNNDNATFCRNCGKRLSPTKKIIKLILCLLGLLVLGGAIWLVWYFSLPTYYIYPEESEIIVSGEDDEYEMVITTDAPYNKWRAYSNNSWISVVKNNGSIRIKCKKNLQECNNEDFNRVGTVILRCNDREETSTRISIIQPESNSKVRCGINRIWTSKTEFGIIVHVNFNVRHMQNIQGCCVIFFYDSGDHLIKSNNDEYTNVDGYVCHVREFTPESKFSDYPDFDIYIPFEAFEINKGKDDITVEVDIKASIDDKWELIKSKKGDSFSISDEEALAVAVDSAVAE